MKNHLIKYLFLIFCWFFVLEVLSRLIINIGPFYETYIKNVSDAGFRLEWIKIHSRNYTEIINLGVAGYGHDQMVWFPAENT